MCNTEFASILIRRYTVKFVNTFDFIFVTSVYVIKYVDCVLFAPTKITTVASIGWMMQFLAVKN